MMKGIEFKVVFVNIVRKDNHIIVETETDTDFELTTESRLGNIQLKSMLSIPRLTAEAIESGYKSFIYYPVSREGLDKVNRGDLLTLTGYK